MERYDYRKAVLDDIQEWCEWNKELVQEKRNLLDPDEFQEWLSEELWIEDSVTGNASGSYTFSTWQAEENLCHNLGLLAEAIKEFGYDWIPYGKGAEWADVTIRCYLLNECISEYVQGLEGFNTNENDKEE